MGDEQNRRAKLVPDVQKPLTHPSGRHLVQGTEGLVHEKDIRLDDEGSCNGGTLLHAAGQLKRMEVCKIGEADEFEAARGPIGPFAAVETGTGQGKFDIAPEGPPGQKPWLLKNIGNANARDRLRRDRLSVDRSRSLILLVEAAEDVEKCRRPAAGWTEDADELSRLRGEACPVKRDEPRILAPRSVDLRDVFDGNGGSLHRPTSLEGLLTSTDLFKACAI